MHKSLPRSASPPDPVAGVALDTNTGFVPDPVFAKGIAPAHSNSPDNEPHADKTVLIIDDQPVPQQLLFRLLRRHGYTPLGAKDGNEAIKKIKKTKPDAIISDVLMPKMDGYEFARQLKTTSEFADTPIIFYTANYLDEESRELARACGIDHILVKPSPAEEILRILDLVLQDTGNCVPPCGAPNFPEEHSSLVRDKLAEKVGELEKEAAEHRSTRKTLNQLRTDHELILNSAGEGICGINSEAEFDFVNEKGAELLGWSVEELFGKSVPATIFARSGSEESSVSKKNAIVLSLWDGTIRRVTNDVLLRKDGSSFRADYTVAPVKNSDGRIGGAIISFQDVSERFLIESRLKLQEEQYHRLFESNPSPMLIFDADTLQILAVNKAAVTHYGYEREELLRLTLKDLEDKPGNQSAVGEGETVVAPKDNPVYYTRLVSHRRKDGSLRMMEVHIGSIIWNGTRARIATAFDVTEQKRAEECLRERADVIDRARDALIVRDFNSDLITLWSRGAQRLFGWSESEAIGRRLGDLFAFNQNQRAVGLQELISTGEFHGEFTLSTKGGRQITVDGRVTLIRNDDGKPRSVLNILTDISEQKMLETQLLRAQRLESIGTLAGGVAHDLNNVLTPILTAGEALRDNPNDEERLTALDLIVESARRGSTIVKQVLTFARGVEGERVTVNVRHFVEEMIDIARRTFPKSIEITSRFAPQLWPIEGDPTQLHQILLNLTLNARDAMPDGGSLEISVENFMVEPSHASLARDAKPGHYVLLKVTDHGHGMTSEVQEKIFDPFFTTKGLGKGTGLGLSTAIGIVQSHGGFISVETEVGVGTSFKVFLPAQADEKVQHAIKTARQLSRGQGELILIVDDEPTIQKVAKLILENHNYRVLCAGDATEAIALFATHKDDIKVVLTDLLMPGMSGSVLLRALRKMKPETAFIASSGQMELNQDAIVAEADVDYVLVKPYDTAGLLNTIRNALERKPASAGK